MKKCYNKRGKSLLHFMRCALFSVVILLFCLVATTVYYFFPVFAGAERAVNNETREVGEKVLINVKTIKQYPDYPTGCESMSALMLLNYYGIDITADEFIDDYLPMSCLPMGAKTVYAEDPSKYFIGDPRDKNSYGCYAPVIEKALNGVFTDESFTASAVNGENLKSIAEQTIKHGKPAIVWVSMHMKPTTVGQDWTLPDGKRFTWTAGEHCMLLVGYSETEYYFNDPMTGKVTAYPKMLCEERFSEMGGQAVLVDVKN